MLGLRLATDPRWVNLTEKAWRIYFPIMLTANKSRIILHHLIQLYPDKTELVHALAPVVTEEWGHLDWCLA
jgi:tRNA-(ms[2]io[6]A)-hydroxylase